MADICLQNHLLYRAVFLKDARTVHYLLKRGADPNSLTEDGVSAFHIAVGLDDAENSETLTRNLLLYGGDPNLRDPDGITPLHIAAEFGRYEILDALLGCGGDPTLKNSDGQTCLDLALSAGWDQCVALLNLYLNDNPCPNEGLEADDDMHVKKVSKPRKSIFKYTEQLQGVIDKEYDQTSYQIDVTSPDHPVLVKRDDLDTTFSILHVHNNRERSLLETTLVEEGINISVDEENSFHTASYGSSLSHDSSYIGASWRHMEEIDSRPYKEDIKIMKDKQISPKQSDIIIDKLQNLSINSTNFSLDSNDTQVMRDLTLNTTNSSNGPDLYTEDEESINVMLTSPERYAVKRDSGLGNSGSHMYTDETILGYSCDVRNDHPTPVIHPDFYGSPRTSSRLPTPESSPSSQGSTNSCPIPNASIETPSLQCDLSDLSDISVFRSHTLNSDNDGLHQNSTLSYNNVFASTVILPENNSNEYEIVGKSHFNSVKPKLKRMRNFSSASTASTCSCKSIGKETTVLSDEECGMNLIEVCLPVKADLDCSLHSGMDVSTDSTMLYDWQEGSPSPSLDNTVSSHASTDLTTRKVTISEDIKKLNDTHLREELEKMGDRPGPINTYTRKTYEIRLARIRSNPQLVLYSSSNDEFCPELRQALKGDNITRADHLDTSLAKLFLDPNPNKHWREGTRKTSFTYLLMDPRVTQNLPSRSKSLGENVAFEVFVRSIFYVGKGKRSRPYAHFKEAIKHITGRTSKDPSKKVNQIVSIWEAGLGVISLHVFQNVIPVEAYTRESCLIQALGLKRLTNIQSGQVYGNVASWSLRKQRLAGTVLLQKAYNIFLMEGERQIRAYDIKV